MIYYPQVTHQIGGNTAGATANIQSGTMVLAGGNNITLSQAGNNVTISGAAGGGAGYTAGISTNGNTAGDTGLVTGRLALMGGNNVTLSGSTNGGSMSLTISGPNVSQYLTTAMLSNAATLSNINVSAGTTSNLLSKITFANSNGISFGLDGSTITGTVKTDYLTTAMQSNAATISNINISGGTTSNLLSKLTLADSNGISFGLNGSTLTATVKTDYLTTAMLSNAATLSNMRVSAGTTSNLLSALTFADSNGLAFGINASTITGSYTVPTQTNQTLGFYAVSNTTQSTSGTMDARTLSFHGAGIASVGISNGSVMISVPSGGGAAYSAGMSTNGNTLGDTGLATQRLVLIGNNNITLSGSTNGGSMSLSISGPNVSQYLTTAMLSNAATISNINVSAGTTSNNLSALTFSNSGGLSWGLNGSVITGGVDTLYSYEPYPLAVSQTAVLSANNGTSGAASFFPFIVDNYVAVAMLNMAVSMSFVTVGTSSGRQTQTYQFGLYTQGTGTNSTTLSQITTASFSVEVTGNNSSYTIKQPTSSNTAGYTTGGTNSAGSNITSGYTGGKNIQFPVQSTLSPGNYWLGLFVRNSTSSINVGISNSFIGGPMASTVQNMAPIGSFSTAFSTGTNVLRRLGGLHLGQASFTSAGQTNLPDTVAFSAMTHNVSVIPYMHLWSNRT